MLLLFYENNVSASKKTRYIRKIRSIIYAMIETCPNITFINSIVSCFLRDLRPKHFSVVDQILRYLAEN